eukprot:1816093-Rhodomonas_salina.1
MQNTLTHVWEGSVSVKQYGHWGCPSCREPVSFVRTIFSETGQVPNVLEAKPQSSTAKQLLAVMQVRPVFALSLLQLQEELTLPLPSILRHNLRAARSRGLRGGNHWSGSSQSFLLSVLIITNESTNTSTQAMPRHPRTHADSFLSAHGERVNMWRIGGFAAAARGGGAGDSRGSST